jgi:tetratricopeptide (TPR) repeat protein
MMIPTKYFSIAALLMLCLQSQLTLSADKFQDTIAQPQVDKLDAIVSLRRQGNLGDAAKQLTLLTQQNPQYYRAIYNLGLAYADMGQTKEAIAKLLEAEILKNSLNIQDPTLDNSLGWAYFLDRQYDNADIYFSRALNSSDKLTKNSQARLYNNYGQLKIYKKNYPEAKKYLQLSTDNGNSLAKKTLEQLNTMSAQNDASSTQGITQSIDNSSTHP